MVQPDESKLERILREFRLRLRNPKLIPNVSLFPGDSKAETVIPVSVKKSMPAEAAQGLP